MYMCVLNSLCVSWLAFGYCNCSQFGEQLQNSLVMLPKSLCVIVLDGVRVGMYMYGESRVCDDRPLAACVYVSRTRTRYMSLGLAR